MPLLLRKLSPTTRCLSLKEEEEVKPTRRGRKPKAPAPSARKGRAPKKGKAEPVEESDEEVENELTEPSSAQPRKETTPQPETPTAELAEPQVEEEEEEEEKSLFDPVPMPHPSQLPTSIPEPSGPKPRLVIHKMVLINFKSYAGRQEIGPFHKSFSAIVGPNGSGKSNTIDALLFVFGYRASKMRQAKVSELIHNSAGYPDLDDCSVEVHFKEIVDLPGPDAFEDVPGSQLVVTRQAYKNNSSRYTINGKTSTYSEVQVLLKGRGIDLDHKRFLILQGEVESIAQMKPKGSTEHEDGLLEYLEDIIGTSKYKEPIEEALIEMERLQEDRQQKLNRLKLVEKEKSALEAAKREAEDYLRLKNDHIRALSRLWQWYIWKCLLAEEDLEGRITRCSKELEEETERNQDDIEHLDALKKHYVEREQAYEELQVATAKALKDLAAHEKQEVGLQERYKHAKGKAKKLSKSVADDTAAKQTAGRTLEDSTRKIEKEKGKVEEFEDSLAEEEKVLEGIRDSLKDKTQGFHDQIEAKQKELQPWTAKINRKQADIDVATSERNALAEKAKALQEASLEAEETLQGLQEDQEVKVTEHKKLQNRKAGLQRDIQSAEGKVQTAQAKVQQYRGKATASRQKVDEARASQSENRSQNRVLDSLTKLKQQGRIQGFHGRLGSLGTIPDKYDVAITTACGSLNHMVVDRVEQGQECIQYLRSQNIGRASFMVLEKLSNSRGMDKISTPENVPRLYDLIKPKEPRFAAAFYKAVADTLVANDLEQANRIAYGAKRWRVVTLAGQMIETSGVMSGGGHNPQKGGMSSKLAKEAVAPDVLKKLEHDTENDARLLQEAQEELQAAEAELDRLTRSGPEIDMALQKLTLDIENGKKRISEAEKRVRDVKAQSKPNSGDLARISELEDTIASATSELEGLQAKSSKIEDAIKALEKKILDIGGSRLLSQKSKVDGIRLHISIANDEITKAEVAKSKAEKDMHKFENNIQSNSTVLEEVESELEELKEQLTELVGYVTELREEVEKAQVTEENSKEDLDKIKADVDEREEEIAVFRKKEMELKQKITDAEKERNENDKILTHWQEQHDRLTLEEIDDEDDEDEEAQAEEQGTEDVEGDIKVKPEHEQPTSKVKKERTASRELQVYSTEELSRMKKNDLLGDAEYLDEKIKNAKPDLTVLKEYKRREEEFMNRAKDLENTTNERDAKKAKYDGLRKQRLDEFMAGFNLISLKLKEMYQMITLGGNAELELVDSLDPFSEGIIFSVMPPKKSWKNISNLSGGEKTLSSLALVFALHVFKPTPLYFMDEIDAALDFRNVSIVANYIKDRTKNAQFIIISLRNDMFELSHRLIGIYKTANTTKSISIDNHSLLAAPSARPPAAHPPASTVTN
ncbi:RecF/RecN/SMC protein [Cyathus striatus]|nr:RecF/RecN/SMC protein [Cyathus striatus]